MKNVKDDLDLGWGEEKKKPTPLPLRGDVKAKPPIRRRALAVAAIFILLALGYLLGHSGPQRSLREAQEAYTAADNRAAMMEQERDSIETSLTAISERMDDLESDLTSATAAAEHWRERAEDASATAAAIRDDNTALKAEVARLQQMKRTAPATSSATQASTTTSSTAGWQTAKVSWYGPGFYGKTMAGGGVLTTSSMVVAHRSMAFGTRIEFRYNDRTCIAVVNDRGPFIAGRTFDLGPGTAAALGFSGVQTVEWRKV